MNLPLITAFIAIMFTQLIKFPIAYLFKRQQADLAIITSTGGMPSSHSAAVSSLITCLILEYGFDSPHVAIATVFGVIVMFDSMGVRRQSGEQGIAIERLAQQISHLPLQEDPLLESKDNIFNHNPNIEAHLMESFDNLITKKYLGHRPSEVVVGVLTGGFVAIVCWTLWYR